MKQLSKASDLIDKNIIASFFETYNIPKESWEVKSVVLKRNDYPEITELEYIQLELIHRTYSPMPLYALEYKIALKELLIDLTELLHSRLMRFEDDELDSLYEDVRKVFKDDI